MIKQQEYARRRRQLMDIAGEDGVVILRAAPRKLRNNDAHYPYRQDSDFLYLSGLSEPGATIVLLPDGGDGRSVLFLDKRDPHREMWEGPALGLEAAQEMLGFDEAYDSRDLARRLPPMLHGRESVHYDLGKDQDFDHLLIGWMNEFRARTHKKFHAPEEIISLSHHLHEMRLFKSRAEISAMRKSARVAARAHCRAMQVCRPGMNEAQIHAELLHTFVSNQCEAAYIPIVGGGPNACILHYTGNRDMLRDGDLLLIDAGAEYDGYASDITRTFPVNGKFSGPQRDLYELVLEAQVKAIAEVREGVPWSDVHETAVEVATAGMIDLGIIRADLDEALEEEYFKDYYVHNTGHWLGLDVHDVGEYEVDGHARVLERGMVMTVEPGIYIPPSATMVDEHWRGLGIRIEDDVVVTRAEADVLSSDIGKTIDEIEALMAS